MRNKSGNKLIILILVISVLIIEFGYQNAITESFGDATNTLVCSYDASIVKSVPNAALFSTNREEVEISLEKDVISKSFSVFKVKDRTRLLFGLLIIAYALTGLWYALRQIFRKVWCWNLYSVRIVKLIHNFDGSK